jgi:hypothetical protein
MLLYEWRQHKNPTHTVFKRREEGGVLRKYDRGVNLLKIHCMNIWNFHLKSPRTIINES